MAYADGCTNKSDNIENQIDQDDLTVIQRGRTMALECDSRDINDMRTTEVCYMTFRLDAHTTPKFPEAA